MVPFRFAGERSVLSPAKGRGVHSVPIPWGGESSEVAKRDFNDIVFQLLQT